MFNDIVKNGDTLTLGEESEKVNNLFIHWSDYGDDYYDLVICHKKTEEMFGNISWCAIPGSNIENMLKELMNKTTIQDVRKESIEPSEWM